MTPTRAPLPAALAAATLLAGCSASPTGQVPTPSQSPAATASLPPGATTLRQMMLRNGTASLVLPAGHATTSRIDQPNVVTLTYDPTAGAELSGWLSRTLPATGWSVDADRDGSLLFHDDDVDGEPWQGAFTCSDAACALTLRNQ